jgi:hypothetical protein
MLVRQRRAPLPLWGWGADLIRHPLGLLTMVPTGMSRGLQAAEPARTTSRTDLILPVARGLLLVIRCFIRRRGCVGTLVGYRVPS